MSPSWCETLWLVQVLAKFGRGYDTRIKGDNREGSYRRTMLPVPRLDKKINGRYDNSIRSPEYDSCSHAAPANSYMSHE